MALRRDASGVVFVEFIIAFAPILLMFLCTVQLSLLLAVKLAVEHAAIVGARAAMVVFEDDPAHYGGEPRRVIARAPRTELGDPLAPDGVAPGASSRAGAVRHAVALVLAPFAPNWTVRGTRVRSAGTSLTNAVAAWRSRLTLGLSDYPRFALAVTFPEAPGSPVLQRQALTGDRVTVRVTFLAPCEVPLGAALCRSASKRLAAELDQAPSFLDVLGMNAWTDLQSLASPDLARDALFHGLRFAVLQAEATLPLQPAGYEGDAS